MSIPVWQNAFTVPALQPGKSAFNLRTPAGWRPIVDPTKNPGRRVLKDGYVEAIGNQMWLGPEFFRRVPGVRKEGILSASWLKVSENENGLLEIIAADEAFCDDSNADIQNRLRQLLFPNFS